MTAPYSLPILTGGWPSGFPAPRIARGYRDDDMFIGPELPQATPAGYHLSEARLRYDALGDRAQEASGGYNRNDGTYFNQVLADALGTRKRGYAPPRLWGAELTYPFE